MSKGYEAGSTRPSDITCVVCRKSIPEGVIAEWLWTYNAIPERPICSKSCAKQYGESNHD